jgi:hypothetical protein
MYRTAQLGLPLLMPSQAQKHVTVNEALARLDAIAQLRVASFTLASPPADPVAGDTYVVPDDAEGDWIGHAGEVATFVNGGWSFAQPRAGWRAWSEAEGICRLFDGVEWHRDALTFSPGGAVARLAISEFDHELLGGVENLTEARIPANALVLGVTGRVIEPLGGTASWRLGVSGSNDRYGTGLGVAEGSYVRGLTSSPLVYYEATGLLLTAEGGAFTSGRVRLAIHMIELGLPRAE